MGCVCHSYRRESTHRIIGLGVTKDLLLLANIRSVRRYAYYHYPEVVRVTRHYLCAAAFLTKSIGWNNLNSFNQYDIREFTQFMMGKLECSMEVCIEISPEVDLC